MTISLVVVQDEDGSVLSVSTLEDWEEANRVTFSEEKIEVLLTTGELQVGGGAEPFRFVSRHGLVL